ncbi:unnamed protein product [Lepidochelys kempii]
MVHSHNLETRICSQDSLHRTPHYAPRFKVIWWQMANFFCLDQQPPCVLYVRCAQQNNCYRVIRRGPLDWQSGDLGSIPNSVTGLLVGLEQVTSPLCASVSPLAQWRLTIPT